MNQMETAGWGPGGDGGFQNDDQATLRQLAPSNNLYFKTVPTYRNRAWWQAEYHRLCSDWPAVAGLAMDIIEARMFESSFERACRIAEDQQPQPAPSKPQPRPTPRTTIEALMYCVRTYGPQALQEPANIERLGRCDKAALAEIDARMSRLKGAGK